MGFIAAMGSNVASALRAILAKKTMKQGLGENMDEARAGAGKERKTQTSRRDTPRSASHRGVTRKIQTRGQ